MGIRTAFCLHPITTKLSSFHLGGFERFPIQESLLFPVRGYRDLARLGNGRGSSRVLGRYSSLCKFALKSFRLTLTPVLPLNEVASFFLSNFTWLLGFHVTKQITIYESAYDLLMNLFLSSETFKKLNRKLFLLFFTLEFCSKEKYFLKGITD